MTLEHHEISVCVVAVLTGVMNRVNLRSVVSQFRPPMNIFLHGPLRTSVYDCPCCENDDEEQVT